MQRTPPFQYRQTTAADQLRDRMQALAGQGGAALAPTPVAQIDRAYQSPVDRSMAENYDRNITEPPPPPRAYEATPLKPNDAERFVPEGEWDGPIAPQWAPPGMRPCKDEWSDTNCYWDAPNMGNGVGDSFIVDEDENLTYPDPDKPYQEQPLEDLRMMSGRTRKIGRMLREALDT